MRNFKPHCGLCFLFMGSKWRDVHDGQDNIALWGHLLPCLTQQRQCQNRQNECLLPCRLLGHLPPRAPPLRPLPRWPRQAAMPPPQQWQWRPPVPLLANLSPSVALSLQPAGTRPALLWCVPTAAAVRTAGKGHSLTSILRAIFSQPTARHGHLIRTVMRAVLWKPMRAFAAL